tara:strand:+ start:285 stop:965 length:681 start_codon:yes stop_codon:yes gene_type:complete
MLALKQALSLVSTNTLGGWQPSDETGLEAWYKFNTGITLNGSDVSAWADSSSNSFDMVQATASEQPAYNSGNIEFTPADTHNLGSASDITLSGAFTIGIKLNIAATGGIIIGDNTEVGELFKIFSTTVLRLKIDNAAAADLELDSETWGNGYMVVTRNASNVLTLFWNGAEQTTATPTLSGTANIDSIGVRRTDLNPYDGTISEIQIYDTESSALTANVNTYLSNI